MTPCVLKDRFEDCQREDREAHRAIWSRVGDVEDKVDRLNRSVERTRGLFDAHSAERAQLDELCEIGVELGKPDFIHQIIKD